MDVLRICVQRGGYRRGGRIAQFIAEWELVVRSTGGDINTETFAAWWKEGNATAYRRLAEFREMFPELGPRGRPSDLMAPLLQHLAVGRNVEAKDIQLMVPA